MPAPVDLHPATTRLARLVEAVPDGALADPTPCAEYSVGDLLDHIGRFALAFIGAAAKRPLSGGPASAADLGPDASLLERVLGLAGRDPAWQPATSGATR